MLNSAALLSLSMFFTPMLINNISKCWFSATSTTTRRIPWWAGDSIGTDYPTLTSWCFMITLFLTQLIRRLVQRVLYFSLTILTTRCCLPACLDYDTWQEFVDSTFWAKRQIWVTEDELGDFWACKGFLLLQLLWNHQFFSIYVTPSWAGCKHRTMLSSPAVKFDGRCYLCPVNDFYATSSNDAQNSWPETKF